MKKCDKFIAILEKEAQQNTYSIYLSCFKSIPKYDDQNFEQIVYPSTNRYIKSGDFLIPILLEDYDDYFINPHYSVESNGDFSRQFSTPVREFTFRIKFTLDNKILSVSGR